MGFNADHLTKHGHTVVVALGLRRCRLDCQEGAMPIPAHQCLKLCQDGSSRKPTHLASVLPRIVYNLIAIPQRIADYVCDARTADL